MLESRQPIADMDFKELRSALEPYSTCDISDALGKLGIIGHLPDIVLKTASKRICGPAHTVEFSLITSVAVDSVIAKVKTSNIEIGDTTAQVTTVHHVDSASPGSVIVIKTPPRAPNAVWGGLMSTRSKVIGVEAIVIEGRIRDLMELQEIDVPVFASGHSTLSASKFVKVAEVKSPIIMASSSPWQVTVEQGDCIVGDADGVVCIPILLLQKVIEKCKLGASVDEKCMHDIVSGKTIKETFAKHR